MSRITKEQVVSRVEELRAVVPNRVVADYSALSGGWRMISVIGDNERRAAKGFPLERVESRSFYHLLNVAIAAQQGELCA